VIVIGWDILKPVTEVQVTDPVIVIVSSCPTLLRAVINAALSIPLFLSYYKQ
jgi:hypothetical protein